MARVIARRGDLEAIVDDADVALVSAYHWGIYEAAPGCSYVAARIDGKTTYLHRLLTNAPAGVRVAFRNGNGLDCRRDNLVFASRDQHHAKCGPYPRNRSGYKGVDFAMRKRRWRAVITVNGRHRHLGYFATAEEAARAYNRAAREAWGEFAYQNGV